MTGSYPDGTSPRDIERQVGPDVTEGRYVWVTGSGKIGDEKVYVCGTCIEGEGSLPWSARELRADLIRDSDLAEHEDWHREADRERAREAAKGEDL